MEEILKAKYPNIHYHVFDAGSGYWKIRNDYPHYLLYQDGGRARKTLENWQPEGVNSLYSSVDGRFIALKEIKALSSIPPGSKVVVIHPKVQERMEQDPAYAQEIFGDEISGVPIETVLAMTQTQVWGSGALCDYPFLNSGRTRPS